MTTEGLIARSRAMITLLEQIRRFAAAEANVLITGESGVGKDVVARALHLLGPRRARPFVKVDCPSLSTTLIEAELFGHERGAFTDAESTKAGRFEAAGSGTVYLDNVGELPLEVQGTLLRIVEEKRLERVGGIAPVAVPARILASADERLEDAVRRGSFRGDLYHRLRVLPLRIPPLRERPADILPLARVFLREACRRCHRPVPTLTPAARDVLKAQAWPGNVRQLRNLVERAVLMIESPDRARLDVRDLPLDLMEEPDTCFGAPGRARPTLAELERRYIEVVLREVSGNQTRAARVLGISRKALWEKRKRYQIG